MMKDQPYVHDKQAVNVAPIERIFSAFAGALLFANALSGRSKFSLSKAMAGGYLLYRGTSGHCLGYDLMGKDHLPDPDKNINIRTSLNVSSSRQEVYNFWRRLENLPLFMKHLESVTTLDEKRSAWKAKIPGGIGSIDWKAEIVKDVPGEFLGWSSLPHADIENAGKVTFRDTISGGTEIDVVISYRAPLGVVGTTVARLFTPAFEKMIREDIAGFKHYIEEVLPAQRNGTYNPV